jgi:GntR family transcriptional regulator
LLGLKAGEPAVQVRRLLLAGGGEALQPVVLDDLWLPGALFKGLSAERLAAWRGPMYRLFEAEFAVQMIRAEEKPPRRGRRRGRARRCWAWPRARRCCRWSGCPSPMATGPWNWRRGLYHTTSHHYRNELS